MPATALRRIPFNDLESDFMQRRLYKCTYILVYSQIFWCVTLGIKTMTPPPGFPAPAAAALPGG